MTNIIIVTLYNEKDTIGEAIHTINIEKATDENGVLVYINHNAYSNEKPDNTGDWIKSKPYYSLEEAIKDSRHNGTYNSAPIVVYGVSKPLDGFSESED